MRAQLYRISADASFSPGTQLAFRALADCADTLAERIESGMVTVREESLPAPGQGALGIECLERRADLISRLQALDDADTGRCVRAERAVSRALGGSCALPLGTRKGYKPHHNPENVKGNSTALLSHIL